jgi:hypothetical protein
MIEIMAGCVFPFPIFVLLVDGILHSDEAKMLWETISRSSRWYRDDPDEYYHMAIVRTLGIFVTGVGSLLVSIAHSILPRASQSI